MEMPGGAALLAAAMGANVTVFGTKRLGLHQFKAMMPPNIICKFNEPSAFEKAVLEADLVVGAILISTHDTPEMLGEALVKRMKPGSMIVDVTCGYGKGYMPTFDKLTTHNQPVYTRFGIQHCKIDAMPASVPLTAAPATSANVAPYLLAMARDVIENVPDPVSRTGLITHEHAVVHPEVLRHIAMEAAHGS
jgi:alanine dehydrogenase